MNRPIRCIWFCLYLLVFTYQGQGQVYPSGSRTRFDPYLRQQVPLDRQTDVGYRSNRSRVGSYRSRSSLSHLYLGPMSNYNLPVVRSLQRKNAYLDPMTSWYGTSPEWRYMRSSPYSTGLSGTQSIIKQRSSMLDPNPSYLPSPSGPNVGTNVDSTYRLKQWRRAPVVPHYDRRYQQTVKPDTTFSQLGGTTFKPSGQYVRRGTGELITGPVNERLLRSSLFRGARPATSEELAQFGTYIEELDIQRKTKSTGLMNRPIGTPIGQDLTDTSDQGISQDGLSRSIAAATRELTGNSWATSGDVFTRMVSPVGEQSGIRPGVAQMGSSGPGLARPVGPQSETGGAAKALGPQLPPTMVSEGVPAEVLRTFVGTEQSQVNRYLAEAEALLKAGQYY
ncbi:MAG: hypothetical protein ACYTF1_06045, partial [Planctomycetota bacterium]